MLSRNFCQKLWDYHYNWNIQHFTEKLQKGKTLWLSLWVLLIQISKKDPCPVCYFSRYSRILPPTENYLQLLTVLQFSHYLKSLTWKHVFVHSAATVIGKPQKFQITKITHGDLLRILTKETLSLLSDYVHTFTT